MLDHPLLEIHNHTHPTADVAWLRVHLKKLLTLLKIRSGEWTLSLVDDEEMIDLHQRSLNLATTTDVLTFDLATDTPLRKSHKLPSAIELDTVICLDEAARQAATRHHLIREELLLYALHSLLHVRGYDDRTPEQARRMHRREDTLLVRLGVGPVYSRLPDQSTASASPRRATKKTVARKPADRRSTRIKSK